MKNYLLAILFLICCKSLPATTVVIYVTPKFVIMAADSKVVFTDVKTGLETSSLVSKIYQRGNVYFALSGITNNVSMNFDVARIADKCLKENSNLDHAIKQIKIEVQKLLLAYLTSMKTRSKALYLKDLTASDYFTSIGLVTIKAGKPYAHLIGFKVKDASTINISTEEVFFAKSSKQDALYYLGQKDAINAYMDTITRISGAPGLFVENLIKLQIAKTPDLVSLPIDIIRLTPKETVWLQRKKGTPVRFR